ncbi:matrixin family metalloprotease [Actinomadura soli]|uniref:Matrixin family metalloprotease n=1 Tax=Actinomadura soli TaxID=2508997 RepID=A0A5C4JDD6_9ACTN|nr:matrixin family metalloprotease [Actinomadura soli]TMR01750.1 matrixin family metalloprotease [Actinomadura soli]
MHGFSRAAKAGMATAALSAALACPAAAGAVTAGPETAGPETAAAAVRPGAAARPPAWCRSGETLSARAMPQKVRIADCDLRGRAVRGPNGLTAVVPADGTSLVAHSLRTGGGSGLRILVDDQAGEITITTRGGRVPEGRPRTSQAPQDPCRDGTHRLEPSKWAKGSAVRWRYHSGTAGLPRWAVAKGVSNMVLGNTDCTGQGRFATPPDIGERYSGESDSGPNVTTDATCGTRDRVNTFGGKAMTGAESDVLAATCIWFIGTRTVETDMALQEHGKRWWTDGTCTPGSYSAEAVVTHEAGHVFGLAHVEGADHAKLTMAPVVAACDNGPATLGKGDHDGLIALYGTR